MRAPAGICPCCSANGGGQRAPRLPFPDIGAQPALGPVIEKTHAERLGQIQQLPPCLASSAAESAGHASDAPEHVGADGVGHGPGSCGGRSLD
jgi:hypothetical protein